jgi:hypothetical protein
MAHQISWHKRPSFLIPIRKIKVSHETNDYAQPIFTIEKVTSGKYINQYKLFQAVDVMFPTIVGVFKQQQTAKKVANLIYKDCRHAPKSSSRKNS